jgi:hypothetical protein
MNILLKLLHKLDPQSGRILRVQENKIQLEIDSLRFTYDTLMKEYEALRQEINLQIDLEERVLSYLFVLFGAVFSAAQLFYQQSVQIVTGLNQYPAIYLLLALMSLLFPLNLLERNLFMANLGKYIRDVLTPKINMILTQLAKLSQPESEYMIWEADQFPDYLRGALKWEDYRIKTQYRGNIPTFAVIVVIRYLFASAPFLLFCLAFLSIKATMPFWISWSVFEQILAAVLIIVIIFILFGIFIGTRTSVKITTINK